MHPLACCPIGWKPSFHLRAAQIADHMADYIADHRPQMADFSCTVWRPRDSAPRPRVLSAQRAAPGERHLASGPWRAATPRSAACGAQHVGAWCVPCPTWPRAQPRLLAASRAYQRARDAARSPRCRGEGPAAEGRHAATRAPGAGSGRVALSSRRRLELGARGSSRAPHQHTAPGAGLAATQRAHWRADPGIFRAQTPIRAHA